ncbi:MAG: tetratricopeptide repeat protein [Planctomycetaceae bacterium]|nr:tetratricopeptide repeat protein [Planctomycetaceae bacterium]
MSQNPKEKTSAGRRVLNLKAIVILAATAFALKTAVGFIHARQVVRTTAFLKQSGQTALDAGDFRAALDYLEQYLAFQSGDRSVQDQVSTLLQQHVGTASALLRAFQMNERLLLADRSRDDIRLRQVEIASQLRRHSDAGAHLRHLRETKPEIASVWHYSGIVAQEIGDFSTADQYFSKAISLPDPPAEAFGLLAQLRSRDPGNDAENEQLLETMIRVADSADSRRIRAQWYVNRQQWSPAINDLWKALEFAPHDARTIAMLVRSIGTLSKQDKTFPSTQQYDQLIRHLQNQLALRRDDASLRMYLASALWAEGRRGDAIRCLEEGIAIDPRRFEFSEVLVDYLVSDRRYQQAQEVFDHLPERAVDRGRLEFMRGRLLMARRQWQEALAAFEMSVGFAGKDSGLAARARTCVAICRRETGDPVATIDAYRSLIQTHPDFDEGRVGIASAYLQADQIDLAIAEYRQLLHVDGVPEFLSNLLIRHNLNQPPQRRDWSEVTELLRDRNPVVTDPVQRSLLQADLLFAQGHPARAMEHLDNAAARLPGRSEIRRALDRLSSTDAGGFQERLLRMLHEDPTNVEAHICMLWLRVASGDKTAVNRWMDDLTSGRSLSNIDESRRLYIAATAATVVASRQRSANQNDPTIDLLLNRAEQAWRRSTELVPGNIIHLVRFVAQNRSAEAAVRLIPSETPDFAPGLLASCWLECLRFGRNSSSVQSAATQALVRLIHRDPADMVLRLAYAESRLLLQQYTEAETLFQQIAAYDPLNGQAVGRLAWIAACIKHDPATALELSQRATEISPSDPTVRSVRGLALAEAQQPGAAIEVLTSIPAAERNAASYVYEAKALLMEGRRSEAGSLIRELTDGDFAAELAPEEMQMLRQLQRDLTGAASPA